ncbi:PucR-like helix-turn-helix protein [Amycolatopsis echigonensis]|uniref:PucR-like helix-turn-helix protein n=1 Tax=Amycolatopsis echigonensis TaxID=2576905 RepID=A0A2N3WS01_9PSEU|nr:PucR family transcriptional regulator [Amycolatopsis niigatensis]PKV96646.1 PucR-like helix-turn-helix protein [Amycolatopsis niigatensis]
MILRQLLALPSWAGSVRVCSGESGLDRPLKTVKAALDASGAPASGELVVVVRPLGSDWQIDALLRRCADSQAAGVLLPGTEPLAASRLLAERLSVPLLVTSADPLDLLVDARLALAAPDIDRAEAVLAAHRALGERLRPPEEIVTVLRRLLDAPVAVLDGRGEVLAGELAEAARVRVHEPVPQRVALADGVLLAHPAESSVWLAAELTGAKSPRADVVAATLAVAAGAVQRWLLAHRLELERDARSRSALLGDLLRQDTEPGADLRRRAADAGWRLGGWHVGLRIGVPADVDTVSRTQEVVRALRAESIDAVTVEHGEGWTGWVTFEQEPTAERVRALSARLRAVHRSLRRTFDAHLGVGRPHADGLTATVAEATDAARLAATRPETGHFLHVDQLGMAQLLLEWTRTDTFEPAARALLAPLVSVPGDLIRTLAAYLDAESSLAETATVLGIHRNTVAARISRIEQLLHVDLSRPDERLALHLAARAVILARPAE